VCECVAGIDMNAMNNETLATGKGCSSGLGVGHRANSPSS